MGSEMVFRKILNSCTSATQDPNGFQTSGSIVGAGWDVVCGTFCKMAS